LGDKNHLVFTNIGQIKKYDSSYEHLWVKKKSNLECANTGDMKISSLTFSQGRAAKMHVLYSFTMCIGLLQLKETTALIC
jgi:hypothetical protein